MQTVTIKIDGMTCGGCVKSVEKALSDVNGIQDIDVSLEKGEANITFDHTITAAHVLVEEIENAGFDARMLD